MTTHHMTSAESNVNFPIDGIVETTARPATYFRITGRRITGSGNTTLYTKVVEVTVDHDARTVTITPTEIDATFFGGSLKGHRDVTIAKVHANVEALHETLTAEMAELLTRRDRFYAYREEQNRMSAELFGDFYDLFRDRIDNVVMLQSNGYGATEHVVSFTYKPTRHNVTMMVQAIIQLKRDDEPQAYSNVSLNLTVVAHDLSHRTRRDSTNIYNYVTTLKTALGVIIAELEMDEAYIR